MQETLILEHNKRVTIKALYQWPTYGGLMEGLPVERINNSILETLPREIDRHCGEGTFYIVEPKLTPIEYKGEYPFGKPIALPNIICIADLTYGEPVKDHRKQASSLFLIWFQANYAFPIDQEIVEKLKQVEWSKYATDFDY